MAEIAQISLPWASLSVPDGIDLALARRVETASLNAWPATTQLLVDGWLLRFARGFTRRANSVVALYPGTTALTDKVRFCENLYARERLQTIFRITTLDAHGELDPLLAARGYRAVDATDVLCIDLNSTTAPGPLQQLPLQDWLEVYAALTDLPARASLLHGTILRSIPLPCCHAILGDPTDPFACGLAVLEHDLLGLFDVVTRADVRRGGHGAALVSGLLEWGRRAGARLGYLQMVGNNVAAAGLYRKLGFRPLYGYWYRISG
jgi:GNAT superfamily N-acetyltransferase